MRGVSKHAAVLRAQLAAKDAEIERLRRLEEENTRLRKAINEQPHGKGCAYTATGLGEPCDCWKAAALEVSK